jgi:holliday junction DNA helicase RuvA
MIGRLRGTLLEKNPPQILIEVGGVGYEVDVPMSTFFNLPEVNAQLTLVTHFVVREDAQLLYGFLTLAERSAFRQLLKVSGVGPKVALAVLSGLSVDDLSRAVTMQDAARLTKVPGIGKKTAERLVLELKDKLAPALPGVALPSDAGGDRGDVINALIALGYSDREALQALKGITPGLSVSEAIRQALKLLAK